VLREIPETSRDNRSLATMLDVRYRTTTKENAGNDASKSKLERWREMLKAAMIEGEGVVETYADFSLLL
jgi:hypothetical protein